MATEHVPAGFVKVATVEEARAESPLIVQAGGRSIGLFAHEGRFYATDNRCPHMGFPLTDGTVEAGVLTCPWHHARFELSSGDTFDPFADDVGTYPVTVSDGDVYLDPDPEPAEPPAVHWRGRLDHGLKENLSLVIAKAVIGLDDAGEPATVPVETGVEFGCHYREAGWGSGLTTLAAMTNLLEGLRPDDRRRALYVGLTEVAADCAGEAPFFVQAPLAATDVAPDRLEAWFRDTIEVRDADGAERVVRAAIAADLPPSRLAGFFLAAATDHLYLDSGHRLDFINKAFETLDVIGWDRADTVLPSLVPALAAADRAEERAPWRQPIDVAALCLEAADDLPDLVAAGADASWTEPDDFVETLLGEEPAAIIEALTGAIETGATAPALARAVAAAAARRIAHFGTSNEFGDWNTVHHTYSYANAVAGMTARTDAIEGYRGVVDAAMSVYLDRFLNVPPAPLPDPDGAGDPDALLEALGETFEVEADDEVDRAGRLVADFLEASGGVDRLQRRLGEALLREDVGFHARQNLEAAVAQYGAAADPKRARVHLIATARYLAAHTPTRRSGEQTFRIADRLHRGEKIHEA